MNYTKHNYDSLLDSGIITQDEYLNILAINGDYLGKIEILHGLFEKINKLPVTKEGWKSRLPFVIGGVLSDDEYDLMATNSIEMKKIINKE